MRRGRGRGMRPAPVRSIHAPGNYNPDNAKVATLAKKKSKLKISCHFMAARTELPKRRANKISVTFMAARTELPRRSELPSHIHNVS